MKTIYTFIKTIFNQIGQAFGLVFIWLYQIIIWLLNNTIGIIFTKEVISFKGKYKIEHPKWLLLRKIIIFILILILVFSFKTIYDNTLYYIFEWIFFIVGKNLGGLYSTILLEYGSKFSEGIGVTLYLSLIGTTIGFIFAVLLSSFITLKINREDNKFRRFMKHFAKKATKLYVTIIRGTPMMVQAMILFWGVRGFLEWDFLVAGLVTVSINTTAYLTEVLRGGIESIDQGQTEGALSLGLNRIQTMLNVIYPQAIKNSMAAIGNEFVINIKDTAVLSVIMIEDIFRIAQIVQGRYLSAFPPFIIAAVIYLFLTTTVTAILRRIEKNLDLPSESLPSSN